jgi:glyoxylate utilization-related uncharacterized protein
VPVEIRNLQDLVRFDDEAATRTKLYETDRTWAELVCLNGNQSYGPVGDDRADALFTIVAGEAVFMVDGTRKRLRQWRTLLAAPGTMITVTNASADPLVLMLVLSPPPDPTAPDRPDPR